MKEFDADKALISVVVPIYNVEPYLRDCLESILNQSYRKIELILVNDGSTDKSGDICGEYKRLDSRIRLIHQENAGLSAARNRGIDEASGEYICFVDSDDMLMPEALERLYELCKRENADISQCSVMKCGEHESLLTIKKRAEEELFSSYYGETCGREELERERLYSGTEKLRAFFIYGSIRVEAWAKLYKRDIFIKTGIRYPVGKIHEDEFIIHELMGNAGNIAVSEYKGYVYRSRQGSIMHQSFNKRRFDRLESKLLQLDYVVRKSPSDALLISSAKAGVIYSCNMLLWEMSLVGAMEEYRAGEMEFKCLYRSYGLDYIRRSKNYGGKLLAALACLSPRLAIGILSLSNNFFQKKK